MKAKETKSIDIRLIVLSIIFISLCLVIPVWQSSVSASLNYRIADIDTKIMALTQQTTEVRAQIKAMTDESYVINMAKSFDSSINVASNRVNTVE